jgi:hypothetical protein
MYLCIGLAYGEKRGQSIMMPRPRPETHENLATKARRHKGFIYNKTFCVTLCPGVFVANFMVGKNFELLIFGFVWSLRDIVLRDSNLVLS